MKRLITILVVIISISSVYATEPESVKVPTSSQIEGKITDIATGEALAGVALSVKGCNVKTYTDLEGKFLIKGIDPGTYDIDVNYVSYNNVTLKEVTASNGDVKVKVELKSASE